MKTTPAVVRTPDGAYGLKDLQLRELRPAAMHYRPIAAGDANALRTFVDNIPTATAPISTPGCSTPTTSPPGPPTRPSAGCSPSTTTTTSPPPSRRPRRQLVQPRRPTATPRPRRPPAP